MNQKEFSELRRRFRPDKSAIHRIYGCFVNGNKEIVSYLDESMGRMPQEESAQYLGLLKKTLSGAPGRQLIDIVFSTQQVAQGEEHKRLSALRDSQLKDAQAREAFYQTVIRSLELEGNYLILLAHDAYDVPRRGKDDRLQEDSDTVFSYLVCCVCPVKDSKVELGYFPGENEFHSRAGQVVAPPELGFLFPAFDDRSANIYDALYYTKDIQDVQEALVASVFGAPAPMPAAAQQESFRAVLGEALEEDCCLQVVQAVHDQLCGLMEDHKESRDPEPLTIGKGEVRQALAANGVSQAHIQTFERQYDEAFGADAQLSPRNLVDPKKIEVKTADVTIKVSPDRGDLIETRILNGVKYILVRVEEGVEVNGVPVQITE